MGNGDFLRTVPPLDCGDLKFATWATEHMDDLAALNAAIEEQAEPFLRSGYDSSELVLVASRAADGGWHVGVQPRSLSPR